MAPPASLSSGRWREWFVLAIAWVIAFDIAYLWQRSSGAHSSEFGGHPDEPAHYLTGLMVRDYVAMGFAGKPLDHFQKFDSHYPAGALGRWPPLFHVVEGVWMLAAGNGRTSTMLFMAALAATLALLLFRVLREDFGVTLAATGAAVLVCLPLVRAYYSLVMAETLSAVFLFAAAIVFGRFLDEGRPRYAMGFGVLAGLAMLTQQTAVALALLVPVAILLSRKWRVLGRPAFWGGIALAAFIAGPWMWYFQNHRLTLEAGAPRHLASEALAFYSSRLGLALGIALIASFCLGVFSIVTRGVARPGRWAASAGLIVGVFALVVIIPAPFEERHLLPALPAAVMFIVAGAAAVGEWIARRRKDAPSPWRDGIGVALLILSLAVGEITLRALGTPPGKRCTGYAKPAEEVLQDDFSGRQTVMISSDDIGEGVFIAELAMREKRPGHTVKRASRELTRPQRFTRQMGSRFGTEDELAEWFSNAGIDYLVVDESMPDAEHAPHHEQLIRAVDTHSERFWPMNKSTIVRGDQSRPGPITLYRVKHVE